MLKKRKIVSCVLAVCVVALVAGMVACAPKANTSNSTSSQWKASTVPEADKYGVIEADSWSSVYPLQYGTFEENKQNSPEGKHDYLEIYPALKTMYKGYAFALSYNGPASHSYSLESVSTTPRTVKKEQLANCITCKSPQYTALVNSDPTQYSVKFNDLITQIDENISCYNCHENDPSTLTVTNKFFTTALGTDVTKVALQSQVCGQCHNEYYFTGENKATTNPYVGTENMTPEAIIAYYDEKNYKDWAHGDTGAPMIKVQHPEFEYLYSGQGSFMASIGYTCADCHMGQTVSEDGTVYSDHYLVSPLKNETLLATSCNTGSGCHTDLASQVKQWQSGQDVTGGTVYNISENIAAYTTAIASKYADEIAAFKEAQSKDASKLYADGTLGELQKYQRYAQYYWDFAMNENSEGAHNPQLCQRCLDLAQSYVDKGNALLNA